MKKIVRQASLSVLLFSACSCGGHVSAAAKLAASPAAPAQPSAAEMVDTSAPPPPPGAAVAVGTSAPGRPVETAPNEAPPVREMLDIEARAELVVADAARAAAALRALVQRHGGMVTSESLQAVGAGSVASLTIRVPAGSSDRFLAGLRELGKVALESVTARDIGKEYFDASVALSNLEATLARYQQILEKAQTVKEILEIEAHLSRIRGEIEALKGNLRWMKDRAARATVHVSLREEAQEIAASVEPRASLHPGVRAAYLLDLRGEDGEVGYYGGGVSVRFAPALGLDLDVLRAVESDARGADGLVVTAGGNVYSEYLGHGRRRFLNPFLGYRIGYARLLDEEDAFVLGAAVGLELYRTEIVNFGTALRGLGLYGGDGLHFGLSPELSLNVAF